MPARQPLNLWAPPPDCLVLTNGEVHVWRISLAQRASTLKRCRSLLSPAELAKVERFHFHRDRDRFTIAHGALRDLLSRYLATTAEQLCFTNYGNGKPELALKSNPMNLRFNLSHSGELALLAVTKSLLLGVDIEFVRNDFHPIEVANAFFSKKEVEALHILPVRQRAQAFFNCWTRKEAYLKARGDGLSFPLESFDVAFAPWERPALLNVRSDPGEALRWQIYDLRPGEEYTAALAVEGSAHTLKYSDWWQFF
jgi:4'-phosphopantetheinyl transferase